MAFGKLSARKSRTWTSQMAPICWLLFLAIAPVFAAAFRGQVKSGAMAIPGAVITAHRGELTQKTITDLQGNFAFADLPGEPWKLDVTMQGFAPASAESTASPVTIQLRMMGVAELQAQVHQAPPSAPPTPVIETTKKDAASPRSELTENAVDSVLINGSAVNGAASIFGQSSAFGNRRSNGKSLYSGSLGVILDNSSFDAKPYSLTGQTTPRPGYNRFQGVSSIGGPVRIPHLFRNGPLIGITYQWMRNGDSTIASAQVPTLAQRRGVPQSQISPQAAALLRLYPLPNFSGDRFNFQNALRGATHDDSLQSRWQKRVSLKNQLSGNFNFQSTRVDTSSIFGFTDRNSTVGINTGVSWIHNFKPRLYSILGVQFSRLVTNTDPFFENRINISGNAGISGNNQDPVNYGPPSLSFASGIATLSDAQWARNRNQTTGVSLETTWNRNRHNLTWGGDYHRLQFNALYQQDPRGSFAFTGAVTGNDFGDFLTGIPDTSSIAFGNADKYFRSIQPDLYVSDDWRFQPNLTLTIGLRWEYSSPIRELYGRLVNLDIAKNFTAASPVLGSSSRQYPDSLLRPDRNNFAPRFGFALRPIPASSLVLRGGYGIYYDSSVYRSIYTQLAQQAPLSTSLRVGNGPENPLSLANGFQTGSAIKRSTFAVDPGFRIGLAHNLSFSAQRDLPGGLVLLASYLGLKGTRGQQQSLPNTYPTGAINPCPLCPSGFTYLESNGNSIRHAVDLEVRRRLHSGLAVTAHYTLSKSIDDASLGGRNQGGPLIAQNWLDLSSERGLSYFDQRQLFTLTWQYTSGIGVAGGMLLSGWRGQLLKEWTVTNRITVGSGMPLTPIFFAVVQGTGVTGSIRANYTGADLYAAPPGLALNRNAFTAPAAGQWGNAGRDIIIGPSQFLFISSLSRTFRKGDHWNIDFRLDSTNTLNHPVYTAWNTLVTSNQFGLPVGSNPMRSLQAVIRARF